MEPEPSYGWTSTVGEVILGATRSEGGTRSRPYRIGGGSTLPFMEKETTSPSPLIAFEICDDPRYWSPIVNDFCGDIVHDTGAWAKMAETTYGADLVRICLTSTRQRGFSDVDSLGKTLGTVLASTNLPLIVEGSNEPKIDSEVFLKCGETGQGERMLLGTAEAGRYRSIAAAALAYNHAIIAQSPIDINLAKQLNILLKEIGVQRDHIVIDPYTGALGYGFEYSYSAMERIRFSALKGDPDLAMPMICAPSDSLTIKEVREAEANDRNAIAVEWELATSLAAAVAGAEIICVRHPDTVKRLKTAISGLKTRTGV